ncbi:MAG: diaminopimelate epimerase [Clostridiales bacterium]|jgi:diaminopimelate epimerase|nr:diaminopimelate epimerase [Clostridiales bacterium]MDN5297993.1 diaminopimelate epimerase [Clostridiales bacterium]
MKLIKSQGTGNDFIIIDETKEPLPAKYTRSFIAERLCDRDRGIGADGILYVSHSDKADAKMRIFNADGSEAPMCGNGLRCFSRYVMDELGVDVIQVETMEVIYKVRCDPTFDQYVNGYEIMLNNVVFKGKTDFIKGYESEFNGPYEFDFVTITNFHAVTLNGIEPPTDETLKAYGVFANEAKQYFPNGVNVNFGTILSEDKLYVRTYERGVGITKSCGTGMTSTVTTYALKHDRMFKWVEVYNDGGKIKCYIEPNGDHYNARFIGNATHEFEAEVDLEKLLESSEIRIQPHIFLEEAQLFEAFYNKTRQEIAKLKYDLES